MWQWFEEEVFVNKMDEISWFGFGLAVGIAGTVVVWLVQTLSEVQ